MAANQKGCVKVADNLYRRPDTTPIPTSSGATTGASAGSPPDQPVKEAKRLHDEFLARARASGLTRDERVIYEQIRQTHMDHCTVRGESSSLQTFLDTKPKHLDPFFAGMRAIEIAQSGAIGQYIGCRKRDGASNSSVNGEFQILRQMFRLAADDEHRLIGCGLTPQIRKLGESQPRQGVITEKQFAKIVSKLPLWAVAPIKAISITGLRLRAVLSRRKTDIDREREFLIRDRESSKNRTAHEWPLSGDLGDLIHIHTQLAQIASDECRLRRVIFWLFHREGQPIPYGTLYDAWCDSANAAGYPGKLN